MSPSLSLCKVALVALSSLFCLAALLGQLAFDSEALGVQSPGTLSSQKRYYNICEILDNQSPASLWAQNLKRILRASQSPLDVDYQLQIPTAQVLKVITPRLHSGLKSTPRDWQALENVIETTNRRLAYLNAKKEGHLIEEARPLKILVLGGSVTKGVNCKTGIKDYHDVECSWVVRLETLLNNLAGERVVDVHLAAVGGTNSATAQAMLEYDLLPEKMREPDIIINAYATNDMHILTLQEATSQNISLQEKIFGMAQNFTRTALQQCTEEGKTPLLLWLDDYLGNEQREILATSDFIQSLQVLAGYYGFGLMSYADTVRDLVYGSTGERSFSPPGWYKNGPEMKREIHPPYPMHIAVSYIVAYTFLQLASNHCGLKSWKITSWENNLDYFDAPIPDFLDTKGSMPTLDSPPLPRPKGLPPFLTSDLKLDDISKLWREAAPTQCEAEKANRVRCPVGWVSGFRPDLKTNNTMNYFAPYIREPFEWEWRNDKGKFGWLPTLSSGAKMAFDFPLEQEIHRIVLFYMKSYGATWERSKSRLHVYLDDDKRDVPSLEVSLSGFHDKETSEVYVEEVQLPRGASRRLQMTVEHAAGKTFKLMGFAICS
jgi:hypothetical protein